VSGTRTPDWILERLHAGDLPPEEAARVRARLAAEERGLARLEALDRDDAAARAAHPPGPALAEIRRRADLGRPRSLARALHELRALGSRKPGGPRAPSPRWLVPALAGAAAMVVAVAVLRVPEAAHVSTGVPGETERLKGAGPRLIAHRERPAGKPEELASGARTRAGDVLQLSYVSAGAPYGAILSIDGRGNVTRHWPKAGDAAAPLAAGGAVPLDHAYVLDSAPSFERFFLVTAPAPFPVGAAVSAARRLAAAGADPARAGPLELPAGLAQTSQLVEKSP
jgi:hypothetical protein